MPEILEPTVAVAPMKYGTNLSIYLAFMIDLPISPSLIFELAYTDLFILQSVSKLNHPIRFSALFPINPLQ